MQDARYKMQIPSSPKRLPSVFSNKHSSSTSLLYLQPHLPWPCPAAPAQNVKVIARDVHTPGNVRLLNDLLSNEGGRGIKAALAPPAARHPAAGAHGGGGGGGGGGGASEFKPCPMAAAPAGQPASPRSPLTGTGFDTVYSPMRPGTPG
eukprot:362568-Chlamydomonas_euryale.AAC.3